MTSPRVSFLAALFTLAACGGAGHRAGDCLLIHNHLWHRSGVNRTASPRRAFTVCLMSESIRCVRRKRAPRTFVPLFRG